MVLGYSFREVVPRGIVAQKQDCDIIISSNTSHAIMLPFEQIIIGKVLAHLSPSNPGNKSIRTTVARLQ